MHAGRIAQRLAQAILHQPEGKGIHRLGAHRVGQHPVGTGRDLGNQVGIARGRKVRRGLRRNRRVEEHPKRCRAVERLFVAVLGDRGPVGGISVHRGGGPDNQVTAPVVVRGELRQIVDHTRAHGHRHGIRCGQHAVEPLDKAPLGVEIRIGEDAGFVLRDSRTCQDPVHLGTGDPPCIGIGHDHRPASGEELLEEIRHTRQGSDPELQRPRVGRAPERTFDFIHDSS